MKVHRVFNNNVISVRDGDRESILTGKGLGFQKHPGDAVDAGRVEKRFVLDVPGAASSLDGLLAELPYEVIRLAEQISELVHDRLGLTMKPAVHFGLADHLLAALERSRTGRRLENPLLWEIKSAYRSEFAVALDAVRLIERETGVSLPIDEVGYLTMHVVNAELTGEMKDTLRTASTVQDIVAIVRNHVTIVSPVDSGDYLRFLTHVKYFVQRLEEGALLRDQQPEMFAVMKASDALVYACASAVAEYAGGRYGVAVSDDELLYLMLHISRVRDRGTA